MTYNNQKLEKKKKDFLSFFFKETNTHTDTQEREIGILTQNIPKTPLKSHNKKYIFNLVTQNQNNNKKVIVI